MAWAFKGIMDAVQEKLSGLIVDRFDRLRGVPNDIAFLNDELTETRTRLNSLEDTDLEDPGVKGWSDKAREMVYDIEDLIDDFMSKQESAAANDGFLNKIFHILTTFRAHHEAASEIDELRPRLQVIHERPRQRPRTEYSFSPSTTIDPRVSALFNEADSLVGIDDPKEEIINQVDDPSRRLKVLSIVGYGGSGKTTLANAVYRQIGGQFDCKAFVSVSQKPTMTTVLNGLLSKLKDNKSPRDTCTVVELIEKLRACLDNKRYLIVVDDLWSVPEWNIISCAFPQNNRRSRIIITTRDECVARACSNRYGRFIYTMTSLSDQHSRKLFFNRIFGSEDCPRDFEDVSDEILNKCSGLPLAIITIASILACERSSRSQRIKWEFIKTSLAAQLPTNNPTLEGMMYILNLSYKSLPHDLRQCFLYLGIYPEDRRIYKTDLVTQWVVEGFVRQDMAESYFNELVNRSMIQPVYDEPVYYEEGYTGEVRGCTVHDMMLDLILRRCEEDNFISLFHDGREVAGSPRRLSLLRILTVDSHEHRCRTSIVLPDKIGMLRHLEGLKLPWNSNCNIPSDVGDLPCLSHLSMPFSSSALPEGIGKGKSLRTINGFCLLESSSQSIEGLGQHTNMEELRIGAKGRYPKTDRWMTALSSSVVKLVNLKVLVITRHNVNFCADAMSSCTPSLKLEELHLYGWTFSGVPMWMRGLRNLRELWLGVMQLKQEDVDMMGTGLKSLVDLNLRIPGVSAERIVISGSTGFSVLKSLQLDWDGISSLVFEAGAMPELQELLLQFTPQPQERDVAIPAGLQHLSSLKAIYPSTVGPESQETERMIERVFERERAASGLPIPIDICVGHARSERFNGDESTKGIQDRNSRAEEIRPGIAPSEMLREAKIVWGDQKHNVSDLSISTSATSVSLC
ncbi:unnamed protein product [Urochloa decumbens]|uniref:Uncharacterized protein n=1 Tax=Urochloa decumbens TaxID=240449 RepID=A0ABC9GPZ4_9POAL